MHTRWRLIGLLAVLALVVIALAVLAAVFLPRLIGSQPAAPAATWPTHGWPAGTPEEAGLDSVRLAQGLKTLLDQGTPLDSVLAIRGGRVVLDASIYPYNSSAPHRLASVTKSFMTTLIAIAADQGKIDLDGPMLSYFPVRTIANLDARKQAITVRNLAGMVNGMQSGCFSKDEETIDEMRSHPDWVQAALDRPMVADPGTVFCYDSPGMHLLSAILEQATGQTALDFARANLFGPLGIDEVVWRHDPQGINHGWGDLYLRPADAAKLGYLWLNHGVWEGRQIVPAQWVEDSAEAQIETHRSDKYGYGWWVAADSYAAVGRGGQLVRVNPALDVIVVTTGLDLNSDDVERLLVSALTDGGTPLPANPEGDAQLQAMLAALAAAPAAKPVPPLPEVARTISGRLITFEPNAARVETMRFEFDDSAAAVLQVQLDDNQGILDWPIGLDGNFRLSSSGEALRGSWTDAQTFSFELTEFGEFAEVRFDLRIEGDRVLLSAPALALSLEGQLAAP
jgi:CubicO group peptidase (beta-lactamase class C family)